MKSDLFCSNAVYKNAYFESENFILVCDRRPILPGHSLLIPKRHVEWITELNDKELIEMRSVLKESLPKLLKAFNADSYNLGLNAGEHAGMVIKHLHFHIVPRSATDIEQGKIVDFYARLQKERVRHIKEVSKEVARLRKIFRYEPKERGE